MSATMIVAIVNSVLFLMFIGFLWFTYLEEKIKTAKIENNTKLDPRMAVPRPNSTDNLSEFIAAEEIRDYSIKSGPEVWAGFHNSGTEPVELEDYRQRLFGDLDPSISPEVRERKRLASEARIRREQLLHDFERTLKDNPKPDNSNKVTEVGKLYQPNEKDTISSLILENKTLRELKKGIAKVSLESYVMKDLGWEKMDSSRRTILNFYGSPGTGKTKAAHAVAKELKKNLLHVDYSTIISKWVGETGKNIKTIFKTAKENNAIVFLDEADTLLNQRSNNITSANGEYLNQEKNILMQELDNFNGVVIMTTNLFLNYDEALIRRISQHVEFCLPSLELRMKLIESHIPQEVKLSECVNLTEVAKIAQNFSGGDIKNMIHDSIIQCALDVKSGLLKAPVLTQKNLEEQAQEIRNTKERHVGSANKIGI